MIIGSLTSHPARIDTVHRAIESLFAQTVKLDMIVLWLAYEQFPGREDDLPHSLLELQQRGLVIEWCEDIRSYKKLTPSLRKYPHEIIITFDDDLEYSQDLVHVLLQGHRTHPASIICHRVTRLVLDGERLQLQPRKSYYNSKNDVYHDDVYTPSYLNKLSGGAGTLYPRGKYRRDILNVHKALELAETSDDIWFWLMSVKNKVKVFVPENHNARLTYIAGTQESGLKHINDSNDNKVFYEHMNNIIEAYPNIMKIMTQRENRWVSRLKKLASTKA